METFIAEQSPGGSVGSRHCVYCTSLYDTVLYCTALYCTEQYCTLLYCTIRFCTAQYDNVLHSTAQYCTVRSVVHLCNRIRARQLCWPGDSETVRQSDSG